MCESRLQSRAFPTRASSSASPRETVQFSATNLSRCSPKRPLASLHHVVAVHFSAFFWPLLKACFSSLFFCLGSLYFSATSSFFLYMLSMEAIIVPFRSQATFTPCLHLIVVPPRQRHTAPRGRSDEPKYTHACDES